MTMMHSFHKKNGDEAYRKEDYHNAVFHYTLAIETARSELVMTDDDSVKRQLASLYSNRAAASTMLRQYHEALVDCDAAIQADESYGKAYLRKAQLQLMNGLLHDAIATCDTVIAMDPESDKARDERINILAIQTKYTQSKEFVEKLRQDKQHMPREYTLEVLANIDTILKTCPVWNEAKVIRAEVLWALGCTEESYDLTQKLVKHGVVCPNLSFLRATIFISMGRSEDAIMNLRVVLAHDRTNPRAVMLLAKLRKFLDAKATADISYKSRRYDDALAQYDIAMTKCPKESPVYLAKLYFNRACTYASLHRHEEAICDCNETLRLNDEYIKAYMRRAASLQMRDSDKVEQYKLAVHDYEFALALCKTKAQSCEIVKKLKETKAQLRALEKDDLCRTKQIIHRRSSPTISSSTSRSGSGDWKKSAAPLLRRHDSEPLSRTKSRSRASSITSNLSSPKSCNDVKKGTCGPQE